MFALALANAFHLFAYPDDAGSDDAGITAPADDDAADDTDDEELEEESPDAEEEEDDDEELTEE
ncbi:MAG: hypothetical protein Q7S09_01890 [bacterium]|nr:hypothetical protein [bacterium]